MTLAPQQCRLVLVRNILCTQQDRPSIESNPSNRQSQLDDQAKPQQFAGDKVKVMGTYDKATKTIRVTSIAPAS